MIHIDPCGKVREYATLDDESDKSFILTYDNVFPTGFACQILGLPANDFSLSLCGSMGRALDF